MKLNREMSVARLAAEVPGSMAVFEGLGIDYSCAGDRSVEDAAHAEGIDPELVIASLRGLKATQAGEAWNDRSLRDLSRHLVVEHHDFLRNELSTIALKLADLCSAPSGVVPELLSVRAAFMRLSEIALPHIHHEEQDVFPRVEAMEEQWESGRPPLPSTSELTEHVRHLTIEHGAIAAQLRTLRELRLQLDAANELPPACQALLERLATLESHLHQYMFLENCLLFPRALALESQSTSPAANPNG